MRGPWLPRRVTMGLGRRPWRHYEPYIPVFSSTGWSVREQVQRRLRHPGGGSLPSLLARCIALRRRHVPRRPIPSARWRRQRRRILRLRGAGSGTSVGGIVRLRTVPSRPPGERGSRVGIEDEGEAVGGAEAEVLAAQEEGGLS